MKTRLFKILILLIACLQGAFGEVLYWHLDLQYSDDGSLRLMNAKELPSSKKNEAHLAAGAPLYKVLIKVVWLDGKGQAVMETESELGLGIRYPVGSDLDAPGFLPEKMSIGLVLEGPGPREQVQSIRIERVGALSAEAPLLEAQQFPLFQSSIQLRSVLPPPLDLEFERIQETGPDAKRFVVVVVGDGYIQADIDDGTFANDVDATLAAFSNRDPWPEILRATNIYRIAVPSNERGADYEDGAPGVGTLKDTYFETKFYYDGVTQRLLYPTSVGVQRAREAADEVVGVGEWDQIIMIVNTSVYGGGGGSIATNSMNTSGPAISVHEVGHSYAGLADEYFFGSSTYPGSRPSEPNVDTDLVDLKWAHWIEAGTPIPTPDTSQYESAVGAFEGARYYPKGIYRPWRRCVMRSLNRDFCPVCKEQHLLKLFDFVDLVDGTTPVANSLVEVSSEDLIEVNALDLEDVTFTWRRDGVVIENESGSTLILSTSDLPSESQEITLTVGYDSDMIRLDTPSLEYSWTVKNVGETASGVPHWWLASYGLSTDGAVEALDPDGDGASILDEYIAGTDPSSAGSLFRLESVLTSSTSGAVAWPSISDRVYTLRESIDMVNWPPVTRFESIPGTDGELRYEFPITAGENRFFKLDVELLEVDP